MRMWRNGEPIELKDIEAWLSIHCVSDVDRRIEIFRVVMNIEARHRERAAQEAADA